MSKSRLIESGVIYFADGRFEARVRVLEVPRSLKFPDGYKVSCVLLDTKTKTVRFVLDNHEPFGYHIHTELPQNKNVRLPVDVKNYTEAIRFFFRQSKKVANEEK